MSVSMIRRGCTSAFVALAALGVSFGSVAAQEKPIQLSVFPPIQITAEDQSVSAVRLSLLFGRNANVTGLDWSFIANHTTGDQLGVQFGLGSLVEGDFTGWQSNFAVNVTRGDMHGLQSGFVNITGTGRGVQWGAVNYAKQNYRGLQLSFVNYAQSINGVQVGLINIIKEGGMFPVFPIVNWGKN
jgi:hypothetical protein